MELDDSFAERLMQRVKKRKDCIEDKKTEIFGKKRAALTDEEQFSDPDVKNGISKESPKRQCLKQHFENAESEKENFHSNETSDAFVAFQASTNKGLAALRKKDTMVLATEKNVDLNRSLDPAELPLSARKALFENALLTGGNRPNESLDVMSVAQRAAMFEAASKNPPAKSTFLAPKKPVATVLSPKKGFTLQSSPSKPSNVVRQEIAKEFPVNKLTVPPPPPPQLTLSPSKNIGTHIRQFQQQLVEHASRQPTTIAKVTEERKQELSSLFNHWEKLSSSSVGKLDCGGEIGAPKAKLASEETYDSEENPKEDYGSEYEDEEERESEHDLDERSVEVSEHDLDEGSVEESENLSMSDHDDPFAPPEVFNPKRFSAEAGLSNFDDETDSYLATDDEAASTYDQHDNEPSQSCSVKSSVSEESYDVSKSQSCSSYSSAGSSYDVEYPQENVSSSEKAQLLYTVSFYRKQKKETRTPPLKTIVRKEQVAPTPSCDESQTHRIQERIKLLQEEILRQQTVIGQTSQALNLCCATAEFSGSIEQVEGERLLLIATQKRQACMNEIQRLKSHGAQGGNVLDGTGTLIISDIQLPLKADFIVAQLEGKLNDAVHCFLCLIRHGPQVIVTQMVSTIDKLTNGALCFTNCITLKNLPHDFSVVFEVYGLQTKKQNIPHDKKYHIKRDHSKIRLTPKSKKADAKLPAISSPGGPNAVRSSSFGVIGFTRFSIQNCNKKCFTLDKVPFTSPLEGALKVQLKLHAEHTVMEKGFLTMFEDVSGFGAWHRRWCALNAHELAYWKYPEDEQKKDPIGMIDLKQCTTGQVKIVARDMCARPNTFQMVVVRPQEKGDKDSLISQCINTLTTTKHLLSADTKDEGAQWCKRLNEALASVRKWDPHALRPIQSKQD